MPITKEFLHDIWCIVFHSRYHSRQGQGGYDWSTKTVTVPMHCVRCGRTWVDEIIVCGR